MSRVVERCTVCGTEHSLTHVGPCEACGGDLGFWCARHEEKAGWLPDRACPLCAREEAVRAAPPPPRPAPPPPPPPRAEPRRAPPIEAPPARPREAPPRRRRPPVEGRPPMARPDAPVLRDEVARHLPGIAAGGASLAWRLLMAFFAIARATIFWGVLGGLLGLGYGIVSTGTDLGGGIALHTIDPQVLWMGVFGSLGGGGLGFLIGLVSALRILFASPSE